MYELSDQKELNLLVGAAKRGVKVRVVLDRDYSGYSVNLPAYNFLRAHRVLVAWGPQNTIVHQKTLTVDGSCAIISTGNLTPQYYATTRDYVVTDTNKAEVAAINTTFSSDFSGRPITSATTSGNLLYSPGSESTLVSLISSATKSVYFESEELSDSYIVTTLSNAARRGVTCDILMTADSEWDSAFATLKASGCSVHLYPNTATGLYIHAKAIVVDANTPSAKIFVGSENASVASLIYNRELGLVLSASSAPRVVLAVTSIFTKDFTSAPERY
jgi:phosphatidylserine/phosphatidylglycerophosphate/cardiolipin synthase-like enzyme